MRSIEAFYAGMRRSGFDAFVLNAEAAEFDGGRIIRWLRDNERTNAPVIACVPEKNPHRIAGILRLGADDCMAPPFSESVLMARLIARRRRILWNLESRENVWQLGDMRICLATSKAFVGSTPLWLSERQFQILVVLTRNLASAVARDQIEEAVWDDSDRESRKVDTHISRLRSKLAGAGAAVEISSVSGFGYRLRLLPVPE